ncbi:MAG: ABC transporter substrate-binding protein [Cyanomargarita calcarea GSE-NOS-MK-12-04C]|jgi:iron complex transport system substrate-binding protein|uniref:ABC transporter substrate-binding protein n=1 Tax=Cyanomargarita calcarea GSE-NOS-MK-12-04C TaxID=2839659 RepID=A0A951QJG0_9CYAN|nr:ABC transporter substrate-binding protein [Cyanomargarita calcarea GSE-NOS-MK-12-04C]
MNQKITVACISIFLGLNLFACSHSNSETKAEKTPTQPIQQAKRVIVLTPLAADLIYSLDKTKLVGVPNGRYTDIIAKSKFTDFPRVGTRSAINLEKIVSLKPDLVIGAEKMHDQALAKLKELGIPTIARTISSWQDLENQTTELAQHIGVDPKPILDKYKSCLNNIPKNGKSVLILLRAQPTSSPNKYSWAGDLLEKFNYKNLVADFQSGSRFKGYLTLSQEKILEANPEKLFIIESDNLNPDDFKKLPFWNKLKAIQNNQVYTFHHDGLITPISVDNLEETCTKLREIAGK